MKKIINIFSFSLIFLTMLFADYDYSLEDINPNSEFYTQNVGTSYFEDQVTMHYFGHFNWSICTARFEELNVIVENLYNDGYYDYIKLVGIGKSQHESTKSNWIEGNDASVCMDPSPDHIVWNEWDANQRDLFVLDHTGALVFYENITGGIPNGFEDQLSALIDIIPSDEVIEGDLNNDELLNVIDVVLLVNLVFENIYNETGDINNDGILNILDVVLLVDLILN